ncbi:MAG: M48 family metallopeptidase [Nocardioides sp.]|uniref:M48 family metallopeptidase n=1 Tax=Nocardioides sp. TaxID=35761 RepID=UPI003267556D
MTLLAAIGFAVVAIVWVPWHPVPGGAPGAVPPESVFTAEQIRLGEDYASWARIWSLLSLAISLVVTSVLGFSRVGERLMARLPGRWWAKVVLGVLVISLIGRIATLPCSVMLQRHRLANGLSTQSWLGFARDVATNEAIAVLTTSIGLLVLLGVARRWTRVWPAIAATLVAALVVLGSFVYPLLVEPLFNDFTPLADEPLRSEILALADQEGVAIDDVLVADASRRTTTLNAYVSGFGNTRRVVVYDNLIESLPRDQALSVIAHELAHARHGDVVTGTALGALGGATGVGLLGLIVSTGSPRRRRSLVDPRIVPFVLALSVWGTLAASPLENGISRQIETRADVDALKTTGDPVAFVEMQKVLALRSLADPTPPAVIQWWWGSHPTTLERIAVARTAP